MMGVSSFFEKSYSPEQIIQVNVFLWRALDAIDLESEIGSDEKGSIRRV